MLESQSPGGILFDSLTVLGLLPTAGNGTRIASIQKRENTVEYIDRIEELTGNNSVDFIILKDGRVLGIDAESVVLYASMEDFYGYATVDRPSIDLAQL